MRRVTLRRALRDYEIDWLRSTIKKADWKQASSPQYRDAPHSYIIKFRSGPEWTRFAELIKLCGVTRSWRGHRYKYLVLDGDCFWVDWPALNRAKVTSLDPLPACKV